MAPARPRGSLPDAEDASRLFLFKKVSGLRATYQVRLLAYLAESRGKVLVIRIPKDARVCPSLELLSRRLPEAIRIERV